MRHLRKRVKDLECNAHPPAMHILVCRGEQTKDDALDEYGRDRISGDGDLIVVVRKPLDDGGSNAVA